MPGLQRIRLASSRKLPSGAIFDRPVMADRLSEEGGGQQELADEIRELAGRLPKAGSGLASVGGTGDPNDGADVISPFGIGEGGVRVENLGDAGFVTRSPLGVLGRSLIDGGRPGTPVRRKVDLTITSQPALASSPRPRPAPTARALPPIHEKLLIGEQLQVIVAIVSRM